MTSKPCGIKMPNHFILFMDPVGQESGQAEQGWLGSGSSFGKAGTSGDLDVQAWRMESYEGFFTHLCEAWAIWDGQWRSYTWPPPMLWDFS